ncbi:kinase-like domain-containing protein [Suillus clintonianus]|uniref:kinase-like domain-containing protein n=1 Tax=Suillus clintonianus TaxID=1904413 RepID=UPI001B86EE10|nr:kinase-like domain-containing protein [Suillus clintonianus]KAG2154610.1 kinase-like domain-containing protein [Suillus clintonianus]
MPDVDLATIADVRKYLSDTPFASHTISALAGGSANFTYRIHLKNPFQGKETFVFKYAAPYVAASGGKMALSVERQKFEVEALRLFRKMHADDDVITVPAVYLFDEEAHVMILDDCGTDARTLKQLVIDEALPQIVAEEIGAAIGRFLGRIHAWNKNVSFDMGIFSNNEVGKMISALVTYGRLISTLSGRDNIAALADPGLDIPEGKLAVISKLAETRSFEISNTAEVFTHGDFWPGNIMVSLRRESEGGTLRLEKLCVLDWELAKAGLRGLDIGQFCAEMRLLQRFYPSRQEEASMIMRSFLLAYRGSGPDEALARVAIAHIGAHLVAWTPRVHWGDKEDTRKTVVEGVELLVGGAEGTLAWLKGSLVGNLM